MGGENALVDRGDSAHTRSGDTGGKQCANARGNDPEGSGSENLGYGSENLGYGRYEPATV